MQAEHMPDGELDRAVLLYKANLKPLTDDVTITGIARARLEQFRELYVVAEREGRKGWFWQVLGEDSLNAIRQLGIAVIRSKDKRCTPLLTRLTQSSWAIQLEHVVAYFGIEALLSQRFLAALHSFAEVADLQGAKRFMDAEKAKRETRLDREWTPGDVERAKKQWAAQKLTAFVIEEADRVEASQLSPIQEAERNEAALIHEASVTSIQRTATPEQANLRHDIQHDDGGASPGGYSPSPERSIEIGRGDVGLETDLHDPILDFVPYSDDDSGFGSHDQSAPRLSPVPLSRFDGAGNRGGPAEQHAQFFVQNKDPTSKPTQVFAEACPPRSPQHARPTPTEDSRGAADGRPGLGREPRTVRIKRESVDDFGYDQKDSPHIQAVIYDSTLQRARQDEVEAHDSDPASRSTEQHDYNRLRRAALRTAAPLVDTSSEKQRPQTSLMDPSTDGIEAAFTKAEDVGIYNFKETSSVATASSPAEPDDKDSKPASQTRPRTTSHRRHSNPPEDASRPQSAADQAPPSIISAIRNERSRLFSPPSGENRQTTQIETLSDDETGEAAGSKRCDSDLSTALETLGPGRWVNDIALERALDHFNPCPWRCWVARSIPLVDGSAHRPNYKSRIPSATEKVVVPFFVNGNHFIIAEADLVRRRTLVYDPKQDSSWPGRCGRYVLELLAHRGVKTSEWTTAMDECRIAQEDGTNCAIFCIMWFMCRNTGHLPSADVDAWRYAARISLHIELSTLTEQTHNNPAVAEWESAQCAQIVRAVSGRPIDLIDVAVKSILNATRAATSFVQGADLVLRCIASAIPLLQEDAEQSVKAAKQAYLQLGFEAKHLASMPRAIDAPRLRQLGQLEARMRIERERAQAFVHERQEAHRQMALRLTEATQELLKG
ncbi:hypothetical protein BAUCODRAFT_28616 [Baudoinia panamericana UAMH 10762]|uniref:Uncharacterized protein n=1 Tax=Baudoinia panamericana (strain UAMH 10762) TaxID=717646 RepID=M2LAQ4_BAUPA|nr:uncharacterized protein BAUCODRAFT_28616 [Baudoinia panamericana UAMH 10762]EMC90897.1 hypothetical protein BAUCODRAFT_28616 [Baudoinia panamericana UAMH 10762]